MKDLQIQKKVIIGLMLIIQLIACQDALRAQTTTVKSANEPFVVEYYYKARWGLAAEFINLFKKNHFPILKKQIEAGRILQVSAVTPRYHATEDGRWDYRVTIVFKDLAAAFNNDGEDRLIKQLFPDQETYRREEQRRFEILLGHWDVPLASVSLDK